LVFIPYNQTLTQKARENRKNPTPAEKKIWADILQGKNFIGFKFTRQKPLDEYIVDFYCSEILLAIEIDGDSHATQKQYDQKRTKRLNDLGITVLRYTNDEVMGNIDGVYDDLKRKVKNLKQPPQSPFSGGG
jgi:very-short-patch-repair endonuclease